MKFHHIASDLQKNLDTLVEKLKNAEPVIIGDLKQINGIYAFYENNVPQYVGRTNNNRMKSRIVEHCAPYSNKNSASFAFRIVKELKSNPHLSDIDTYDADFISAKQRISKMTIRFVEVDDPIIQTILEPYMAFHLDTLDKYNDFRAH